MAVSHVFSCGCTKVHAVGAGQGAHVLLGGLHEGALLVDMCWQGNELWKFQLAEACYSSDDALKSDVRTVRRTCESHEASNSFSSISYCY